MFTTPFDTNLGPCAISWDETGITGFHLLTPTPVEMGALPGKPNESVSAVISRVQAHLQGVLQDFSDVDYDYTRVSKFHRSVYEQTLAIKVGRTCSYGDIARQLGQPPGASRAVGAASGANPWPLLIPCHRVVAGSGKMTGFSGAGGIKTKLRLLALEGAQLFAE
ncbi:MAG: methylated-DNA--[protein]-cysteine S-methyltransferase [Cephaloticoccus sp.]|nr:methylated-DNA--[protein]-cysteine S-methyltransferase [Cephaloticoccus sp.]MCF7759749.1 methylated-DNA--[protein]-cysteine S-methyltransferase [Cephaloticoccus sp.]